MKARYFLTLTGLFLLWLFANYSLAQNTDPKNPKKTKFNVMERLSFGGYLGAQFGDITMVNISPIADLQVTNKFNVGLGVTYQFYKDTYYDYRFNAYGTNIYARFYIWRDLFAHAEYAPIYYDNLYNGFSFEGVWFHDILLGGGYRQWIGDKAFLTFMFLWNVNEQFNSPYQNPIIRIGFGVGI